MAVHSLSKLYGKLPIDVIFPTGGYSDAEAQMFNWFVAGIGLEKENRMAKQEAQQRKRRGR